MDLELNRPKNTDFKALNRIEIRSHNLVVSDIHKIFIISDYKFCPYPWNIFSSSGLVVVDIDPLQLEIRGSGVGASGVDAVLVGDDLPELGSDLVSALSGLDVDNFSHGDQGSEDVCLLFGCVSATGADCMTVIQRAADGSTTITRLHPQLSQAAHKLSHTQKVSHHHRYNQVSFMTNSPTRTCKQGCEFNVKSCQFLAVIISLQYI